MTEQFISELSDILNKYSNSSKITLKDFNIISKNLQNKHFHQINFNTILTNMKFLFENNQTEISKEDFLNKAKDIIIKNNLFILTMNSDKIANDLEEILAEAHKQNDNDSIEDLNYIIKLIQTENIYDSDSMFIINNDVKNDINKDGIKYLMQYSNMYDKKLRAKDFKYVRSSTISLKKKIHKIKIILIKKMMKIFY